MDKDILDQSPTCCQVRTTPKEMTHQYKVPVLQTEECPQFISEVNGCWGQCVEGSGL